MERTKNGITYPENIMQALQARKIGCSYDKGKRLVYVLYEGRFGGIYSIYSEDGRGGFINFTLYPFCVAESRRQETGEYLAKLNRQASPVTFYIDQETGCIAFCNQYRIPDQGDDRGQALDHFCLETHKACINYQVSLYMAVNKGKNHINREPKTY
ncbi:MAG: hypothetical protein LBS20_03465 [Prevotella sp.]|jgi:hypothetical protein|nr:hypothetical protein [Prevotella sp.]